MGKIVTLKRILQAAIFKDAKVVAGTKGLDRQVKAVTVAEIPDIAMWLQGGDFVHCVAKFMDKENGLSYSEKQFCDWVRALNENGAACLAIKTQRYLKEIPKAIIDLGNELDFPIIELAYSYTQNDVTQAVMEIIINAGLEDKRRNVDAYVNLCSLIAKSNSLDIIIDTLSKYLGNYILLENTKFEYLASSGASSERISELCRVRRSSAYIDSIRNEVAGKNMFCGFLTVDKKDIWEEIYPVIYKNEKLGYLTIFETATRITENDRGLLKTCLNAVALIIILHKDFDGFLNAKAKVRFINNLLNENWDGTVVNYYASLLGIDEASAKRMIIVSRNVHDTFIINKNNEKLSYKEQKIIDYISDYFKQRLVPHEIFVYQGRLVLLAGIDNNNLWKLIEIAANLVKTLRKRKEYDDVIIAIGREGTDLRGYRQSYFEASFSIKAAVDFKLSEEVIIYEKLELYGLLVNILRNKDMAKSFGESILGVLATDADKEYLQETLREYLEANGNYVETGRRMFLHVNTIKYRIKRIEGLISVDLATMNGRCSVWIALKICQYLKSTSNNTLL